MTAPAVDAARLDGLIDLPADGPGVAAAVVSPGGTLWSGTAGLAPRAGDGGRYTRFHLVSLSKPFTAAALAAAAAEGRLSLDDDIRRHLPEMAPPDHGQAVTVRHLLSMTSGLDDMLEIERLRGVWHRRPGADLLAQALVRARTSAPAGATCITTSAVLADEILRRLGHASADGAACRGLASRSASRGRPTAMTASAGRHGRARLDEGRWRRATDISASAATRSSRPSTTARWARPCSPAECPPCTMAGKPTPLASAGRCAASASFLRQWRGRRASAIRVSPAGPACCCCRNRDRRRLPVNREDRLPAR
jgi:hypothetical protein